MSRLNWLFWVYMRAIAKVKNERISCQLESLERSEVIIIFYHNGYTIFSWIKVREM